MEFKRLTIPDVILCQPKILSDERGYFTETFRLDKLRNFSGYEINFCQDNESRSSFGVLRGLHYQLPPHAQTKLVRVIRGRILDVVLDVRFGSPTFGQHVAVELDSNTKDQLLVPKGCAHGFVVLSEEAIFAYKVDAYYHQDSERGIAYSDPVLGIDWGIEKEHIKTSIKDSSLPLFKDAEYVNLQTT
ncbi:dTDP-4-dehydrorhamnose 3,5-epimerase [Ulvibacterium marinum]|uniref:dTDP-4-dehydrorhamnose 3,5-epimerase n=1 Tax=Ulvibacterium marinum TaxID=2419782 RepID=UPI002494A6E7|nr:dTDP-4-dehydrorhamnose 3,5-epimerase [Ulvibacterium marinum]